MRLIPVIDVRAGRAVHAVAGERAHYRPVRSVLHASADPIGLAWSYRELLGLDELYLADLDAISGAPGNGPLFRTLHEHGFTLWVDAGLRQEVPDDLLNVRTLVAGLETLAGAFALSAMLATVGPARLVFSLDLRRGQPLRAEGATWSASDALGLAEQAIGLGVRRLFLLDLAHIGRGGGTGTIPLLSRLLARHPGCEISVGGGVAGLDDLLALQAAGASAVLLASALHDGRIGRAEVAALRGRLL